MKEHTPPLDDGGGGLGAREEALIQRAEAEPEGLSVEEIRALAAALTEARAETRRLQLQLHQSQRMEAMGRMAGGVAHDFNNLLTGIRGNLDLALLDLPPGSEAEPALREANRATDRAAEIVAHLLAFSRKEVTQRRRLDLNELVAGARGTLEGLLGDQIELSLGAQTDSAAVLADAQQLERALVNLAINAKEAMPQGGRLSIETSDVILDEETCRKRHPTASPGHYVALLVTDSGVGMTEAVLRQMYEPFFTTKAKGRGTGLGLSMVYGVVQQHGGLIEASSTPGVGTTFQVLLPSAHQGDTPPPRDARALPSEGPPTSRGETILLVEDSPVVRQLTARILKRAGYGVIIAENGLQALVVLESRSGSVDLVLSDVVMPQMSGGELARRLEVSHPGLSILLMSGYAGDELLRHGVEGEGANFIAKPFSAPELLERVRGVLDEPRPGRES